MWTEEVLTCWSSRNTSKPVFLNLLPTIGSPLFQSDAGLHTGTIITYAPSKMSMWPTREALVLKNLLKIAGSTHVILMRSINEPKLGICILCPHHSELLPGKDLVEAPVSISKSHSTSKELMSPLVTLPKTTWSLACLDTSWHLAEPSQGISCPWSGKGGLGLRPTKTLLCFCLCLS